MSSIEWDGDEARISNVLDVQLNRSVSGKERMERPFVKAHFKHSVRYMMKDSALAHRVCSKGLQ